ncbi:MAG: SCP2 sterol-binding domain-containing protein [Acidimicrobiales bacterium]|nr:SCP2 sterol-binding domain-containing protein [Acidimicrobiales bacterium]
MPRFLSDEWIAELDDRARALPELVLDGDDELVVQHTVSGVPGRGEVTFHLHLSSGPARVRSGPAEAPTVTFSHDHDTATALAAGEGSAQAAFMAGRLRVGGQIDQLIARHGQFAGIDDVFAALRAVTEF